MTSIIVTGISAFLLGMLFLYLSISFLRGRNINLIAGYSALSDHEKNNTDKTALLKSNGKTLCIVSILMIVFSGICLLAVMEIITIKFYRTALIVFILSIIIIVLCGVIFLNKKGD